MSKKKVLFLSAANSIHTVRWVNALSESYEIHLVYCKNHVPSIDSIDGKVVLHQLKYKSPFGYYSNARELNNIYNSIKPDIINVHYASGYGTLARIAKLPNILLSIWGSDVYSFPQQSKLKRNILIRNVMYADCIASTSQIMSEQLKKIVPNINKKIYITPFGVDVNKFKKMNIERLDDDFNIGNIKSLELNYGIEYLILGVEDLINKLKKEHKCILASKIKLYIYGDGSQKDYLDKLIKSHDLGNNVFLMGKIPNDTVPAALNRFDVFCVTSLCESFGVSVVEAMACEVPVIATNVDGFSEIIDNKKDGILIDKADFNSVSIALEKMLKDSKLRKQYGKNGRKKVLNNFDWEKNVAYMKSIYNSMLKRRN